MAGTAQRSHSQLSYSSQLPVRSRRCRQVHALLLEWRQQAKPNPLSQQRCHNCLKKASLQALTSAATTLSDRHNSTRKHPAATSCSAVSFENSNIAAGIPVSPANTALGHQLWQVLRDQPGDFPTQAQSKLEDLSTQHAYSDEDTQSQHILAAARQKGLIEDVMYYWALAEAYLADTNLQNSFRLALHRPGNGPLAQGNDTVTLQTRVKLLDGQDGQYMIGSVHFSKPGDAARSATDTDTDAIGSTLLPSASSLPALSNVMASARGQALLDSQGSLPSRMSREGAARTYHMYIYWGYFNRRMAVRRQMEQKAMPGFDRQTGIAFGDNSKQQKSYYGEMTNVWRYFENVPDAISDLRTSEAVAVADRHLRALFGDQEECLTTLIAWQQMTHEAKWFGRALYDAEEMAIRKCGEQMTNL